MFRLIAIVLTSTFLLLALFGTSSEQMPASHQVRAMGMMGALASGAGEIEEPRRQYVSRHHQPLKTAPEPGACRRCSCATAASPVIPLRRSVTPQAR